MENSTHIAIIGAGPAGLIAAETLACAGRKVTVYDRMPSLGRKLLMAGRGGLNLTHSEPLEIFLTRYGIASGWLAPAIRSFTPDDLRAWCEGLGQETFKGSSGRIFPRSMKAAPLLRAWLVRLAALGVDFKMEHTWHGWENGALVFTDKTGNTLHTQPTATLLALGGASWPRLGSNGAWVDILTNNGVDITPLRPANCGFTASWSEYFRTRFAGLPLKPVAITHEGVTRQGEIMITAQGIEGGAVYALSARLRDAIATNGYARVTLDIRPSMRLASLVQKLSKPQGNKSLSTFLRKAGFSALDVALLRELAPYINADDLAAQIKGLPLTLYDTTGLPRAISTAGGIAQMALDEGFMLKTKRGVFACGEMLDWEAPTGGYLLQACFSTGIAAAKGIERFLSAQL